MALPKVDHPLYDFIIPSTKKSIKIRAMLSKEERLLLMAKESEQPDDILEAIKQACNNCMIGTMDADELSIFDLELLFIKLRAYSVSNMIQVSYKDGEDEQVYDFQIDLGNIAVKFPDHLDKIIKVDDKISIRMKYPPASLYSNKEFLRADGKKIMDLLVMSSIDAVLDHGTEVRFASATEPEIKEFLDSLPIPVFEKIREFLTNLPTVYHEITYKNKMDHERKIVLSTLNDFFTLR